MFTGAPEGGLVKPSKTARPAAAGDTFAIADDDVFATDVVDDEVGEQSHAGGQSGVAVEAGSAPDNLPKVTPIGTKASTMAPPVWFASLWSRIEPLSCAST